MPHIKRKAEPHQVITFNAKPQGFNYTVRRQKHLKQRDGGKTSSLTNYTQSQLSYTINQSSEPPLAPRHHSKMGMTII